MNPSDARQMSRHLELEWDGIVQACYTPQTIRHLTLYVVINP
jgi:hypothetical protein